jgi:predicted ATPase
MRGGVQTITNRAQRYKLATFHLEAGLKAYSRVAFPDASLYLESGIEFLRGGEHWSDEYQLTLDLLNAAVDAALCNQDFTRVAALVQEIQERGHSLKDKLPAYLAQINALGQHESVHEATRVGMDVLQQLGEFLPRRTSTVALIGEIIKTKVALRKRTNESILTLPPMEKENKIAAMNIMSILLPYAFQSSSRQAVVIGARLSRFCLRHGMHTGFALGLATFAMVLCRSQKKEGYRLGILALDLVRQNNSTQIIPRMYFYFYGLVHHWSRPLRKSLDPLSHAVKVGGEIGDIEYAMIALRFKCLHAFHCGEPLHVVESMAVEAAQQMRCFKQDNILRLTMPMIQLVQKLRNENPISENCVSFRESDEAECSNKTSVLFTKYNLDIEMSYLLGDYDNVETIAALKRQLKMEGQALYSFAVAQWKEALSAVAQAHLGIRKWRNVKLARQVLKQMKRWAVDAPENFWHKTLLLEAELKSLISDDSAESRMKAQYVKAIRGALREHFTHEAAVACELLGDYMKRKGKRLQAEKYWNRALQLYLTWGARVKASQLVQRIEQHAQHSTAIDSA